MSKDVCLLPISGTTLSPLIWNNGFDAPKALGQYEANQPVHRS